MSKFNIIDFQNYSILEVVKKSKIVSVKVCEDDNRISYEPQAELELKEPGRFSVTRLVGTLSGKATLYPFKEGDLVAVNLKFWGHRKDGEFINRIYIDDIKLVKELNHLYL